MIKTLKQFSLLFVFIFSMISAESKEDQYRLYVTMVDPEFHCFALSNNMVFNIPKKNWETTALPEVGTEVYITPWLRIIQERPSCNEGDFVVRYSQDSMKEPITVWMTKDSEQYGLSCISSEFVCTQPAGWLTPGVYQNVLTLSDGSKWTLDAKVGFTPGDRILMSKIKEEEYRIIDIDRVNVITLGNVYIAYEDTKAKPYVPVEIAQE
jgi:hypothetical protein